MTNTIKHSHKLNGLSIFLRWLLVKLGWLIPTNFKRLMLLSTAVRIYRPEVFEDAVLTRKLINVLKLARYPEAVNSQRLVYKWLEETEFSDVRPSENRPLSDLKSISTALANRCPSYLRYGGFNDIRNDILTAFTAVTAIANYHK